MLHAASLTGGEGAKSAMETTADDTSAAAELVNDDYFPPDRDPTELHDRRQQERAGHGDGAAGGSGTARGSGASALEAYMYSDDAVHDLRSHTWIIAPSPTARLQRWQLVNCMRERYPPPAHSTSPAAPRSASASVTPTAQAEVVPAAAKVVHHNTTPSGAPQTRSSTSPAAPSPSGWFDLRVFPAECQLLLADLAVDTHAERWILFELAATVAYGQRQAGLWAASWWPGSAGLAAWMGGGGPPAHFLSQHTSAVDHAAGNTTANATAAAAAAPAAARAVSPLLTAIYVVRLVPAVALHLVRRALHAGHRWAVAALLPASSTSRLLERDSMVGALATNAEWRLQVEWMLTTAVVLLLVVCALITLRYRKYTRTLEMWEAEMRRHDALEVARWAAEAEARHRAGTLPSVAAGAAATTACESGRRSGAGSHGNLRRDESLADLLRAAAGGPVHPPDLATWSASTENSGAIDSDADQPPRRTRRRNGSHSDRDKDALVAQSSAELLQGSFRGCGAAGLALGTAAPLAPPPPLTVSLHLTTPTASLPVPLLIGGSVQDPAGARLPRSPPHAAAEVSSATTSVSRTHSWMDTVPLHDAASASSEAGTPRKAHGAATSSKAEQKKQLLLPTSLFSVSSIISRGDPSHTAITGTGVEAIAVSGVSAAFIAAVTGSGAAASLHDGELDRESDEDEAESPAQQRHRAIAAGVGTLRPSPRRPTAAFEDDPHAVTHVFRHTAAAALVTDSTPAEPTSERV